MQTCDKILIRSLWAVALTAFAVRLVVAIAAGAWNAAEEFEYSDIARSLLAGKGYSYTFLNAEYKVFGFPLFPLLLWLLLKVFGHGTWPAQLMTMAVSSAAAVLAGRLCWLMAPGRRPVAVVAALVAAFHPGLVYYSVFKIHELPLVFFWTLMTVQAATRPMENPGIRSAAWFGLILGSGFLLRPTIVLAGPAAFAACLIVQRAQVGKYLHPFFLAAGVAFLIVLPWWIRNYQATGKVVLTSTVSGVNRWMGFNPHATGTNLTTDGRPQLSAWPELVQTVRKMNETEQNDYFNAQVSGYFKQNPARMAVLFLKNCYYFWWLTPTQGAEYRSSYKFFYVTFYVPLLVGLSLFLARLNRLPQAARLAGWTAAIFLVLVMAAQAANYVEGRHRWGVEGLVVCLSAAGYAGIFKGVKVEK